MPHVALTIAGAERVLPLHEIASGITELLANRATGREGA
jgi:hypothetical protein